MQPHGAGFHNMMEACGPIRADSPLSGGSSAFSPSFVYSFIQQRPPGKGSSAESCPEHSLYIPLVENRAPLWMDGTLCDYPHPTIYLRCGLKTNKQKLVNQDFSASVLVTKADLGARSFSVVGTAVHAGMFSGIAGFRPLGASNRLPQPNPAVRAKNVSGCLSNVL